MAFIDSSELGHCPTAQLLIENEVPSRIAAKDGSVFDFWQLLSHTDFC